MAISVKTVQISTRPIPSLRWWIGGLLLASTIINYIDRQTLSALAPYLKQEYHWTNTITPISSLDSAWPIPWG
jgi:hypothetical protein